jgi:hypothetical protein
MDIMSPHGPGVFGVGSKTTLVDSAAWGASAAINLYMDKGTGGKGTLIGHRLQAVLAYAAAPGAVDFTDQEMRDFKTAIFPNIKGQSTIGPMVTSQASGLSGGDIDLINRVLLRQAAGGSLDFANGSFPALASGVIVVEVPLYHYNQNTGKDHCPDLSLFSNLQLQVNTGVAAPTLAGTSISIVSGRIALWADYLPDVPGASSHLRWDQLSQSSETDTLPAQERLGHLITGNTVTYSSAMNALAASGAVVLNADVYQYKIDGRSPYATDGYLNNALPWQETIRRSRRGYSIMPGADRYGIERGVGSYQMIPLAVPSFQSNRDTFKGEIVIQDATNAAGGTRVHTTLIVQRAGR